MPNLIKESVRGLESLTPEDLLFTNREIFLTTGIDSSTSNELIKQLMILEKINPQEEITIYINSPGGEVVSGLAVYDYIELMKAPVRTVCIGTAASMGAILFLAGDKREMLPHTRLMIHDPAYSGGDMAGKKPHELQQYVDKLKQSQKIIAEIIAHKTGKTLEEVYEKTKEDSYFNAEEAMEYGLATGVVNSLNSNREFLIS
ncbi:MAG: ATP-dependent Clp protease proteolytic subunit [Lachnospiraceae bacterium]|nr:ATP-dependent Clp protease proteolytic subunit [Lachnospiraceae bacterium]